MIAERLWEVEERIRRQLGAAMDGDDAKVILRHRPVDSGVAIAVLIEQPAGLLDADAGRAARDRLSLLLDAQAEAVAIIAGRTWKNGGIA